VAYLYFVGTILFTVIGQLLLKWRISIYGDMPGSLWQKVVFLLKLFLDPIVIVAFAFAFIASLFWMAVMTKFDVSFAYPFVTAGLTISTVVSAVFLLGEPVTMAKALGVFFILVGLWFLSGGS